MVAATAVGLAGVCGLVAGPTEPIVHPVVRVAALDADSSNASQSLVGQMRTSLSAWLYMRADLYLHNGVELRTLSQQEIQDGRVAVGSSDHLEASDASSVTVIPSAENDYRGVFGDIERACSTYKPMEGHGHQRPTQALPLFRLMTMADPQFIAGWTMGSSILAGDHAKSSTAKALAYLKDGLRQNLRCIELWSAIGILYAANEKDYIAARDYLNIARGLGQRTSHLSQPESDALRETYRWLALIANEIDTPFDRIRIAREGLEIFPDDPLLSRLG